MEGGSITPGQKFFTSFRGLRLDERFDGIKTVFTWHTVTLVEADSVDTSSLVLARIVLAVVNVLLATGSGIALNFGSIKV